jgi:hypothetical protein
MIWSSENDVPIIQGQFFFNYDKLASLPFVDDALLFLTPKAM